MLIAMADESGVLTSPNYFSIAAYIGTHNTWAQFDRSWKDALRAHRIDHFHMWQFAGSRAQFKGWAEERRRALMHDLLMVVARSHLRGVAAVIRNRDFQGLPKERQHVYTAPWMVCFYEVVGGIGLVGQERGFGVDCVYSQQDQFKPKFTKYWRHAQQTKDYGTGLGDLHFQDMRTTAGLQAADLLAWELRHFYHLAEVRPELPMRFPLRVLMEHQRWQNASMIKSLPGWYVEFQAKRVHDHTQTVIYSDLPRWEAMYRQLSLPGYDGLERIRELSVLERYIPVQGARGAVAAGIRSMSRWGESWRWLLPWYGPKAP